MIDLDELASLVPEPASVEVVYRQVYIPRAGVPDPLYVVGGSGRWGTEWTLHTAVSPHVAWAEYCRNAAEAIARADPTAGVGLDPRTIAAYASLEVGDPVLRRSLYLLRFDFVRLVDLTTDLAAAALRRAGFSPSDFTLDDFGGCPELAQAGVDLGWEALLAPSAAWQFADGRCIAVFQLGRERLIRFSRLIDAARPTIATAYATTYRDGERPTWLGADPRGRTGRGV